MDNKIYFELMDGSLIDNYQLANIAYICSGHKIAPTDFDSLRAVSLMCDGIKREIKNPSIKYQLKLGNRVTAIKLYRDRHPDCSVRQAYDTINRMAEQFNKKEDNK